jgi:acyl carrier protein
MQKINQILIKVLNLKSDQITDDLSIENVESWDSLTHMDLITSLEEEYGFELSMDEIIQMTNLLSIRRIIQEKIS